jgi:hypothetical protein
MPDARRVDHCSATFLEENSEMRPMRVFLFAFSLLLAAACGTANRSPRAADVTVRPLATPFFGSALEAPVDFEVAITNRSKEPLRIRTIRVSSTGMTQYAIRSRERLLNEPIAPGETKEVIVPAMALTSRSRLTATEPLSLRVNVGYEANGRQFRELYQFPRIVF